MRYILLIILFFSVSASAQYKAININKVIIRYDTTLVNEIPEAANEYKWVMLRLKSNNDTLAIVFYNGSVWTKADIVAANITQIGTTTTTLIALPSTVAASTRYFLNDQVVYQYSQNTHSVPDLFKNTARKKVIRISDGRLVAEYFGNGFLWHVMPANPTLISQGIIKVLFP